MAEEDYVGWDEVVVSGDRGRREVHYYLKRRGGGGAELAVVGREKSARHMAYHVMGQFERSAPTAAAGFSFRWKSRREVVDWLSSLVSDSHPCRSSPMASRFLEDEDAEAAEITASKDLSSWRMRHHSKEFSWLGSAWSCRKRRKHYRSFCRNGVTISVHDFVHIMAEDNKRLVAYVEDLYEDMKESKMVSVRWFHKVDEVAIVLPPDVNEREIFFSLCLQDFSVECIDGLAAVLSTQHFEKFQNETRHSSWEPYLCCRQIDNDDVKPFDITQVQGYWSQEVLRSMYSSSLKLRLKITNGSSNFDQGDNGSVSLAENSGHHRISGDMNAKYLNKFRKVAIGSNAKRSNPATCWPKEFLEQKVRGQLYPGCLVEVLSQDSSIRGCWFQCTVLKKHQDRVKVRYQDVQDADGTGKLEEWLLASRVAAADKLGIRICGRPMVRPQPSDKGTVSCSFSLGAVVDAWWHDGWWEGIVIRKESEQKIHVYFPGEQRVSIFTVRDLRHSQDWVCHKWNRIDERPDIASSLLMSLSPENRANFINKCTSTQASDLDVLNRQPAAEPKREEPQPVEKRELRSIEAPLVQGQEYVPNLLKDCLLDGLRWISSRKRRRGREMDKVGSDCKRHCDGSSSSSRDEAAGSSPCDHFMSPKSLTVDHENCKAGGDLFSTPITASSLVMSR